MFPQWSPRAWYEAARVQAAQAPEQTRRNALATLERYQGWLPGVSLDEIVTRLKRANSERIDALPSLSRYPELRGMRELILAEWRGIRDGAGLGEDLLAAVCNGNFYYHRNILGHEEAAGKTPPADVGKCTCIYFPTSDRGPLFGNNVDSDPGDLDGLPKWPALNEHLLWGTVSSGIFADEVSPEIFPVPLRRLLARYCRSTAEGVEMLTRYNYFWGPANALLVDRDHTVAMIEKSACRIAVRQSDDGFGYVTAMTAEAPDFRAYLDERRNASLKARGISGHCADIAYWDEADNRRSLIATLLKEQKAAPSFEGMRAILQHRSPAGKVAYHGDRLPQGGVTEYTLRSAVCALREREITYWEMEGERPSFEASARKSEYEDEIPWS